MAQHRQTHSRGGIGFEDKEFGGVRIVECTTIENSLFEVIEGGDFEGGKLSSHSRWRS